MSVALRGQEIVLKTDFAVRDFIVVNDSLFFIKKRNLFLDIVKLNESNFIGGYGLELFNKKGIIITSSNELTSNVSSVRFFNKKEKKQEDVYYYQNGKIIDFLIIPNTDMFVLSLSSNKIIVVDFKKRPKFNKIIEINLQSISRKVIYKKSKLFFTTDKGNIFSYDLKSNKKELILSLGSLITDFELIKQDFFIFLMNGIIIKYNLDTKKKQQLTIKNDFIINSVVKNNKIICGSWRGSIYIINKTLLKIMQELKYHKSSIIRIKNIENNVFYSSSLDNKLKKWVLID